ncbi:MAG TPA: sulfite exporter TauE/SafE family protein [Gaiella sp.]
MTTWTIVAAIALGLGAGMLSGMFGVGGGILFVPTLVLLGLGQVEASATSLLAIVPTAAVGAWRQRAYGNLRVRAALVVGVVSVLGAEVGVQIATRIDENLLRRLFGVLVIGVAAQLAVRTVRQERRYPDGS